MAAILEDAVSAPTLADAQQSSALRTFRPDVEGLRAVAVLLVVLYHAGVPGITGGYVGVDVFFVISGFLITGLLLREFASSGRFSMADFYARRARRILPIASVVLIATVAASALILGAARLDSIAHDGLWTSFFAANFHFAQTGADYLNATAPPSPLQHYWSLAVEEQFYLAWPALLLVALVVGRRLGDRARVAAAVTASALVIASLTWSIVETTNDANQAYFSPFTRGWELGAGALVAICAHWLGRMPAVGAALCGWIGLGLIAFAAFDFTTSTVFPGAAAAVPVLGAVFVIIGGLSIVRGGPEKVLANDPMRKLGGYSYSLYLLHWPILILALSEFPDIGVPVKLGLIVVSFGVSVITYRWVENPTRRSPRLTKSVRNSLVLGVALVVATAAYSQMFIVGGQAEARQAEAQFAVQQQINSGSGAAGGEATSAEVEAAVAASVGLRTAPKGVAPPIALAARDMSPAYQNGCLVDTGPVTSPPCEFGDVSVKKTVVLLGDSHAAQWLPALSALGSRNHFRVVVLTKHSCPVADVSTYDGIVKRFYSECVDWRQWALGRIKQIRPDMIVASETSQALVDSSGHQIQSNDGIWQHGLATTLAALTSDSRSVYFLSDTPEHHSDVPICLQESTTDISACGDPAATAIDLPQQVHDQATVRAAGARFVDVVPWVCSGGICPAVIGGMVTTFDDSRFTATYSAYLTHALGTALGLES